MAALISWVCNLDHGVPDRRDYLPSVTLHDGKWAYCLQGGDGDHTWCAIEPAPIEMLSVRHRGSQGSPSEEVHTK